MGKKVISSVLLVSLLAAGIAMASPDLLSSWYETLFRPSQEQLIQSVRQQEEEQVDLAKSMQANLTEAARERLEEEADRKSQYIRERVEQKTVNYEAQLKKTIEAESVKYEQELERFLAARMNQIEADLQEELTNLLEDLLKIDLVEEDEK